MDKVKDDIKEKGLSANDVYDPATWRRMLSYIDPHKSGTKIKSRKENDQERYREANKESKRVVAIAKKNAYSQLYEELKEKE